VEVAGGAAGPASWTTLGNSGIAAATNFIGTINNADWVIKTFNTEKMRVMAGGNVGIGTSNPEFKLSLDNDGAIISKGTYASGATLITNGAGTRMIWYPKKAAFRAGIVSGTQWDNFNIGEYSFASGYNTKAIGIASVALGDSTTASNFAATAMGDSTIASGIYSTAIGHATIASGGASTTMGYGTRASGSYSLATGYNSVASGSSSTALGVRTLASGIFATALGQSTIASGNNSTAMGNFVSTNAKTGSFVAGDASTGTNMNSSANNEFSTRFVGGYRFFTNNALTAGVSLTAGAGAWASVSDRRKKENFLTLNAEDILLKIKSMPVTEWNYKAQNETIHHIGPMAQDFYLQFKLGGIGNDTTITTTDIDGVNMLGIQALEKRTGDLKKQVSELQEIIKQQKEKVETLENKLSAAIESNKKIDALTERLNKLEKVALK